MKLILAAMAGFGPAVWLLAQTTSSPPDSITGLLTGSAVTVLAAAVIAFVRGWVVPGRVHDRVVAENDILREEIRNRNIDDRKTLLPMIVETMTEALRREQTAGDGKP